MKNTKGFNYKEYKIVSKEEVAPETFLFTFEGHFDFNPGQFVQASLDHYGDVTLALCNDPNDKKNFKLCIRAAGGTTDHIVRLSPSDYLKIRGPYGNGWPTSKLIGKNVILIAGGMGIVPIMPLLYNLHKYKSEFKKIYLVAGFKTDHHIIFKDELFNLKNKINSLKVIVEHASRDFWGEQGLITDGLEKININPKNTLAIICGPEVMLPFCTKMLIEKGIPEHNIYISFERRMECGIGVCQHCNIGKYLVCEDGPVFSLDKIKGELKK